MRIYKVLSILLDYPEEELMDHLVDVRELVIKERGLAGKDREEIVKVLDWMESRTLIELQQNYVQTFDSRPENSLHLTHHLFGDDDRGRGPALINLGEHYKGAGLSPVKGELPDYLPLVLEYLSTLEEEKAGLFLCNASETLTILAENLEREDSPYASLVRIVERHGESYRSAA